MTQVTALREHLRRILGWFPDNCLLAEIEGLEAVAEQANALYEGAQNRGAPDANEMRITAEGARRGRACSKEEAFGSATGILQ